MQKYKTILSISFYLRKSYIHGIEASEPGNIFAETFLSQLIPVSRK